MPNTVRLRGTFLVLLRRPNCVLIASDTAAHDGEKQLEGVHHKILCHPSLPLAMAIGGTAAFEVEGQMVRVEDLIRTEFDVWAKAGRANVHTVKAWAEKVLAPLIVKLNAELDEGLEPSGITILAGVCRGDSADSVSLHVLPTGEVQAEKVNAPVIYAPGSLQDWTGNTLIKREDLFGAKLTHVDQIIGRAKEIVESAIQAERDLVPFGGLLGCGGPVEVVLVEPVGARFVVGGPVT
jgi:hypothetical protein